mmetsp:Transcript_9870/g.36797  ORF Transcript_9870/g.36797 Transcript_9870/m.36797 type:complete len:227 (-) Transcript_9870:102-782(-)
MTRTQILIFTFILSTLLLTFTNASPSWSIIGIKSENLNTDIAAGMKSYEVFQKDNYTRIDTSSMLTGDKTSTTVDFSAGLYYLRLLSNDFCVFEHLGGFEQGLDSQFQKTLPVDRKDIMIKTSMGQVVKCDSRIIQKNTPLARAVLFYFFNEVGPKWDQYNVTVYTASDDNHSYTNDVPQNQVVRLLVQELEGAKEPTFFDLVRLDEQNVDFPDSLFQWNIRKECH